MRQVLDLPVSSLVRRERQLVASTRIDDPRDSICDEHEPAGLSSDRPVAPDGSGASARTSHGNTTRVPSSDSMLRRDQATPPSRAGVIAMPTRRSSSALADDVAIAVNANTAIARKARMIGINVASTFPPSIRDVFVTAHEVFTRQWISASALSSGL
jgi:hypothetical protein